MSTDSAPRWFVVIARFTLAAVAGLIAFTAAAGVLDALVGALIVGLAALVAVLLALPRSESVNAALIHVPGRARVVFAITAVLLLAQLAWTSAFIVQPNIAAWMGSPWLPIRSSHSCLSAYWIAGDVVRRAPDIWDDALYNLPEPDPTKPRRPRPLGPVQVDNYEYPPPFLVLPRALALVAPGFWRLREVWFAVNLAIIAAGLIAVGWRVDRKLGTHAVWLTPAVLGVPAMIATLQIGNVQLAVIAAAMLAMLLFERRQPAAAGVLLAYATLSKLYPGVLILYLLLRRDWRALGWTTAAAVAILLVTVIDFGVGPYQAFLEHFPRLLGGEAFPALQPDRARRERVGPRPDLQAAALRHHGPGLRRVEGGRLAVHHRGALGHRASGVAPRRAWARADRLARPARPGHHAEPVPPPLRPVPLTVAGDADRCGYLGSRPDLCHRCRMLGRAGVHVRPRCRPATGQRRVELRAHDLRLHRRRPRAPDRLDEPRRRRVPILVVPVPA